MNQPPPSFAPSLCRAALVVLLIGSVLALPSHGAETPTRVPGEGWMRFTDVSQAGFDPALLEGAREAWEGLPSSALMVIADGAVVANWGDTDRRFMCHSVRKSFLTGLYGIYWDKGEIELNKTLADLGIDDEPEPLLETEKQARILDLLKARSGVFHPAAYAGRTDSRPRGSEGPGRFFAYNNWDFNTAAAILMQETGDDVFEAFDEHFGDPLQMEDWRVSDGYYHYERDKSKYPAYPFRMSARDAARFGLLYARMGKWGDERILSEHWVRRSSAMYSIDNERMGYGFMWWVFREPVLAEQGMFAALGVGNQMIAVLPESDLVIVNRANTYAGERTPMGPLINLIKQILEARTGTPVDSPQLAALEETPEEGVTEVPGRTLEPMVGEWAFPPPSVGLPPRTTVKMTREGGHLVAFSPNSGTFTHYLQPDGSLLEMDTRRRYYPVRGADGNFEGIAPADQIMSAALVAAAQEGTGRARAILGLIPEDADPVIPVGGALVDLIAGKKRAAKKSLEAQAKAGDPALVEGLVNRAGYELVGVRKFDQALAIFEFNTELFPDAFNTWDSLGEAYMALRRDKEAIAAYQRSIELNPGNENAQARIERIRARAGGDR